MLDKPSLEGNAQAAAPSPFAPPTKGDGLTTSERHSCANIEIMASSEHSDVAYALFKDAYSQIAAKTPTRVGPFLNGVESHLLTDHYNASLAAEWGLERLGSGSSDSKLSQSELRAIASDDKQNPFTKAMARELSNDILNIKPLPEGGFLGFGQHPADSVSKLDLERFIDSSDHRQQTFDMGTELLSGKNSVFDQVARNAHKNPNDPDQALTQEDFANFADSKTRRDAATNHLVRQVIDRWSLISLNALAKHFDGDATLSKQSIRTTLSEMDSTGYYR